MSTPKNMFSRPFFKRVDETLDKTVNRVSNALDRAANAQIGTKKRTMTASEKELNDSIRKLGEAVRLTQKKKGGKKSKKQYRKTRKSK
jgi:hypothetical protein